MAKLYEIDLEMEHCIDYETGEIDTERLESLQMERDRKIDGILSWIKNLRADAEAIRNEEKALAERRQTMTKRADRLTWFISQYLAGERWSSPRNAVSWRKSDALVITDSVAAINWCREHAQTAIIQREPDLDKNALKQMIKAGISVDGAEVEQRENIQIK